MVETELVHLMHLRARFRGVEMARYITEDVDANKLVDIMLNVCLLIEDELGAPVPDIAYIEDLSSVRQFVAITIGDIVREARGGTDEDVF